MLALRRRVFAWGTGAGACASVCAAVFDALWGVRWCAELSLGLAAVLAGAFVLGTRRRWPLFPLARAVNVAVVSFFAGVAPVEIRSQPEFLLWMPVVPLTSTFFFGAREGAAWSAIACVLVFGGAALQLDQAPPGAGAMLGIGLLAYLFLGTLGGGLAWLVERYDKALREQMRRRVEMQKRLDRAERERTLAIVAAGVAHDFNNLLFGVSGNLELALSELPATHPARTMIELARAEAERGAEIVQLLRDYAGSGRMRLRPMTLDDAVREAVRLARIAYPRRTIEVDARTPLPIHGEPTLLARAIWQLIVNAIEASDASSPVRIEVKRAQPPASIASTTRAQAWGVVHVLDRGRGIDPSIADRMFDPFATTKPSGSGLGLAAAAGIVRRHRGAIAAESRPGGGSCVSIWLPLASTPPER